MRAFGAGRNRQIRVFHKVLPSRSSTERLEAARYGRQDARRYELDAVLTAFHISAFDLSAC
jgi:hypothetical protein